jgi:hypothetical protein
LDYSFGIHLNFHLSLGRMRLLCSSCIYLVLMDGSQLLDSLAVAGPWSTVFTAESSLFSLETARA